jgi:hypothetical protein
MDVIIAILNGFCTVFFKKENSLSLVRDEAKKPLFWKGGGGIQQAIKCPSVPDFPPGGCPKGLS